MEIADIIAKLQMLFGQQQPMTEDEMGQRREIAKPMLGQEGTTPFRRTADLVDLRRQMMEAYRTGNYEQAQALELLMRASQGQGGQGPPQQPQQPTFFGGVM